MATDFDLWARELAQDTVVVTALCACGHSRESHEHYSSRTDCVVCGCMNYRAPQSVSLTITLGWVLILVLTALVFIGAWVVGTHIISWIVGA